MTTTEKLTKLADRIEARKTDRAKAEAAYEATDTAYQEALKRLKKEFKVATLAEAEELLKKMRKKTETLAKEAEELLGD